MALITVLRARLVAETESLCLRLSRIPVAWAADDAKVFSMPTASHGGRGLSAEVHRRHQGPRVGPSIGGADRGRHQRRYREVRTCAVPAAQSSDPAAHPPHPECRDGTERRGHARDVQSSRQGSTPTVCRLACSVLFGNATSHRLGSGAKRGAPRGPDGQPADQEANRRAVARLVHATAGACLWAVHGGRPERPGRICASWLAVVACRTQALERSRCDGDQRGGQSADRQAAFDNSAHRRLRHAAFRGVRAPRRDEGHGVLFRVLPAVARRRDTRYSRRVAAGARAPAVRSASSKPTPLTWRTS